MRVLVLDACQRAALACVRSLGQSSFEVIAADEIPETLAGVSKYCCETVVYPSPYQRPRDFVEWAKVAFLELKIDAVLPVTEVTTDLVVRNRDLWPSIKIPFAGIKKIDDLSNKVKLFQLASSIGVPVPRSVVVENIDDLHAATESIGYPIVFKPARSRVLVDDKWEGTVVKVVENRDELDSLMGNLPNFNFPALCQEFVPGKGLGIFALYKQGKQSAYFSHKRLREKPPEGGVSVLSESRLPQQEVLEFTTKLLDASGWEGVAMVEYRASEERGIYLMEVNARLWGSLQLAIDAGVNFPALLLAELSPNKGDTLKSDVYKEGVKLRWFLGDLDRLYLLFKHWRVTGWRLLLRECVTFGLTSFSAAKNEVFRLSDSRPGIYELKNYFKSN
jgi:predicted ATP-grasp superfamily ATP-dependent carboligase